MVSVTFSFKNQNQNQIPQTPVHRLHVTVSPPQNACEGDHVAFHQHNNAEADLQGSMLTHCQAHRPGPHDTGPRLQVYTGPVLKHG
ncbi:unnamed protein product [Merluccius merluccius]